MTVSSSPLCNGPTPSGVPVNTTSPALRVKKLAHISDQRNDFMDHVRSRTLLALFAVYAQAQRCICGSPVNSAAGINPESGQKELSNALAFSHGCPAFFIFPEHHAMSDRAPRRNRRGFTDMLFRSLTQRRANQYRPVRLHDELNRNRMGSPMAAADRTVPFLV